MLEQQSVGSLKKYCYYIIRSSPNHFITGFVQEELITDLLKECARMFEFSHPNVLTLTGVCLDGGPAPYIIMPFMANGSLLSYLKEERESVVIDPSSSKSDDVVVSGIK